MIADTEIDVNADLSCISNIEWDKVSVCMDGTILDDSNNELDLNDVLAAFAAVGHKLKRMVAIAKGDAE